MAMFNMKEDVGFFLRTVGEIINIPSENSDSFNQLPEILKSYLEGLKKI